MFLENVAMLAADTSRSKAYLQALVRNALFPEHVFLLSDPNAKYLPGQSGFTEQKRGDAKEGCWSEASFDLTESLETTLTGSGIPFSKVASTDINSALVVDTLVKCRQEVLIYSGYGGALLRADILSTGKRFLHVHGGYLPDYKGSTTNYYSLLAEDCLGASSLFLTAEIDSGPVLVRRRFPAPPDRRQIDHVYDAAARAAVLVETLRNYLRTREWQFDLQNNEGGETYFIVHPVLKHIAILAQPGTN